MSILRAYALEELGTGGYPNAWTKGDPTIKHLVREEAGHRCVRCGHPYRNGEHGKGEWSPCDERCTHYGPGRHLPTEVEHRAAQPEGYPPLIDPDGWVYFDNGDVAWMVEHGMEIEAKWRILTVHHLDGVKLNCRWWNLAALCQRCHLTIQGKVKMHQTYPWEHSGWFRPYAAGYYAFTYLGQNLTRAETTEHMDELLSLECLVLVPTSAPAPATSEKSEAHPAEGKL